jgi:hypothetical protein
MWRIQHIQQHYGIEWQEEHFDGAVKNRKGVCFSGVNWESSTIIRYKPNVRTCIPGFKDLVDAWADELMSFPWFAEDCRMEGNRGEGGRTFYINAQVQRDKACTMLSLARCLDERPGQVFEFFHLLKLGAIPARALAASCFIERNHGEVYEITSGIGHSPVRNPESRKSLDEFVSKGPVHRSTSFESVYLWNDGNAFPSVNELEEWALTGVWSTKLVKILKYSKFGGLTFAEEIPNRVSRIIVDGKVVLADKSLDGWVTMQDIRRAINA